MCLRRTWGNGNMKNLIIGLEATDERYKEEIHNTFLKDFGIDLDSDEFANDDFCRNWETLLKKCGGEHIETILKSIVMFKNMCLNIINPCDVIIRSTLDEEKLRIKRNEEFIDLLRGYSALLDNFYIYEADVWLNAWLAIQYEKCDKRRPVPGSENTKTMKARKPKTGFVDTATGVVKGKKEKEYALPFEEDADGYFCGEYLKYTLGNTGALFWTEDNGLELDDDIENKQAEFVEYDEEKNFERCMSQRTVNISVGKNYERFSYKKIEELEKQKSFQIEDKILFHKTINGIWVRNIVNTMIDYHDMFEVENFIGLMETLCECKSLVWQNLISYIFIPAKRYQKELEREGVYDRIVVILFAWISNIGRINYRLARLTEGFIYLYQRAGCPEKIVEEKCEYYLEQLELKYGEEVKKYWAGESSYLRMSKNIDKIHKSPSWIYAIFQRDVIHRTKYLYRNKGFPERSFTIKEIHREFKGVDIIFKDIPVKFIELCPD